MTYNPAIHHRRSIRLKGYDYSQAGMYFITLCAHNREALFGEIVGGVMRLNDLGKIAAACWNNLPRSFPNLTLDQWVVMPNHFHGILVLDDPIPDGGGEASAATLSGKRRLFAADASPQRLNGIAHGSADSSPQRPNGIAHGSADASPQRPNGIAHGSADSSPQRPNGIAHGSADSSPQRPNGIAHGSADASPQRPNGTAPGSMNAIVQNYKSIASRKINACRGTAGAPVWQRNYWESIIRDESAYANIAAYIVNNPLKWENDKLSGGVIP
jgi:REP element-mobilizing transposase RayT